MEYPVQFPDPRKTDKDGLVAIDGELSPGFLLSAYAQGVFPWFSNGDRIMWWCPNPRMILFPKNLKVAKSLRQVINSKKFEIRIDTGFKKVIDNCSKVKRENQDGTWITTEMKKAYVNLHKLGYAHSFETYMKNRLVGGLYGISLGKVFFGESMFFYESNASKVAFYYLVEWCKKHDFHFIDAQQSTGYLKSLGAVNIERDEFLERLDKALQYKTKQGNWDKRFKL